MSNPNEGLEQLLKQFDEAIRATPFEGQALTGLFRNWLIPILKDFGIAINQTALGLGEVANAAASAQAFAERTMTGDALLMAADLTESLLTSLGKKDYETATETAQSLATILEDWMPEGDETEAEPEIIEPEPEPEPVVVEPVAEKPTAKKPAAKKTTRTRKKPAVKEAS